MNLRILRYKFVYGNFVKTYDILQYVTRQFRGVPVWDDVEIVQEHELTDLKKHGINTGSGKNTTQQEVNSLK